MSMLLIATTAALSLPEAQPTFFRRLIMTGDPIMLQLFVDPTGRVLTCESLLITDENEEGQSACTAVLGKDAGSGASGPAGEKVHGDLVISVIPSTNDAPNYRRKQPDLIVTVNELPDGAAALRIPLLVYRDATGMVRQCAEHGSKSPALDELACDQLKAHAFPVRVGEDGQPVPFVTSMSVVFATEAAS